MKIRKADEASGSYPNRVASAFVVDLYVGLPPLQGSLYAPFFPAVLAVLSLTFAAERSVAWTNDVPAVPPTQEKSKPPWPDYLGQPPRWVTGPRCGPNSLYVMLTLHGINADIDETARRCGISDERGCSIDDLQRVAGEFGLETEVRFVSPSAMMDMKMPFIAHLSPGDEQSPSGHFLVVFDHRPSDDAFGLIDGTSGDHSYRDSGVLAHSFSGYVLVAKDNSRIWLLRTFVGGLVVLVAVVARQYFSAST